MVTIPLVVLLGVLAACLVKWGGQKVGGLVVGVLFGLALASTAVGPPIVDGLQRFCDTVITSVQTGLNGGGEQ